MKKEIIKEKNSTVVLFYKYLWALSTTIEKQRLEILNPKYQEWGLHKKNKENFQSADPHSESNT